MLTGEATRTVERKIMPAKIELTLTCEYCKKEEKVQVPVIFSSKNRITYEEFPGTWRVATKYCQAFSGNRLTERIVACSADCEKLGW